MKPLTRLLSTVGLFVLIGPPVGAITLSLVGYIGALVTSQPPGIADMLLYGGLMGIVLSWLVGGVQAAFAGAATAVASFNTSLPPMAVAAAAGLVTGSIHSYGEGFEPLFDALVITVHVVPAVFCAWLARSATII